MTQSSNLGLLFFVVALIYLCFLVALIFRTAVPIFSVKQYPNKRQMQVFRAFYGSLWLQMVLNSALYWVLFGEQAGDISAPTDESGFKAVALIFIPTILMSLDYALMYLQLEDMQKRSRVQGGIAYINKSNHEKLQKVANIVTFTYVGLFILVQAAVMVLTVAGLVVAKAFLVELNTLIFILMILLNVNATVQYCRNAGSPYLDEKKAKYVRRFKTIVVVWNLAFITKFFLSSFMPNSLVEIQDEKNDDFWYSVETFVSIMFTEIIPFYFIIDKKIIKIFTLNFLELRDEPSELLASPDASYPNSRSNSVEMDDENQDPMIMTQLSGDRLLVGTQLENNGSYHQNQSTQEEGRAMSATSLTQLRLTNCANQVFSDTAVAQERVKIEQALTLETTQFVKGDPFTRPWYLAERKFLKPKLGAIFHCTFKDQQDALCRVMNYDRISVYQIEAFFTELARLSLYKMTNFVVQPLGVHVSSKMEITMVLPELVSLHELVHQPQRINGSEEGLDLSRKIDVLIELAKVLNQFHTLARPVYHGNLNSHNVFVDFGSVVPKVRLGELEMSDFKKYANMFYSYRAVSVWSPPECLKQQKKRLEPTREMDVYAFGMIMWELLYEKEPFDGVVKDAIEFVVEEDARPLIQTVKLIDEASSAHMSVPLHGSTLTEDSLQLTEELANIIRRCWQTNPSERLKFANVVKLLMDQKAVLFDDMEDQLLEEEDSSDD